MKLLIPKERNRYLFYALFVLNVLLLFCNYALNVSIPFVVFIAILAFAAFLGDMDELISVCICCIAWSQAIKWHYVVIFCCLIFVIKYGRKIKPDVGIIPIVLIVIWEFLHCFSSGANLKNMVSYTFLYVFLVFLFFIRDMKTIDYTFIMRNFAIAVFSVCCILMLRLLIHNNFSFNMAFFDMQRLGLTDEEIGGLVINPNSLGVLCVLAVGVLMQVRSAGEKKKLDIFLIILILVLGALTCSRTYLVCLLILCVFLFVTSNGGLRKKLKFLLSVILVLVISLTLMYLIFPETLNMFIQRFNVDDISNGRNDLVVKYNEYLFSSVKAFLWGLGSINLGEKVLGLSIAFNVPHNGIQEIMVAWGIIGLLLFIGMIFVMIRRSKQENPHQSWTNYALLIVLLAKIMVGQVITSNYTMLSFALIYLSLCHDCSGKGIDKPVYK